MRLAPGAPLTLFYSGGALDDARAGVIRSIPHALKSGEAPGPGRQGCNRRGRALRCSACNAQDKPRGPPRGLPSPPAPSPAAPLPRRPPAFPPDFTECWVLDGAQPVLSPKHVARTILRYFKGGGDSYELGEASFRSCLCRVC